MTALNVTTAFGKRLGRTGFLWFGLVQGTSGVKTDPVPGPQELGAQRQGTGTDTNPQRTVSARQGLGICREKLVFQNREGGKW